MSARGSVHPEVVRSGFRLPRSLEGYAAPAVPSQSGCAKEAAELANTDRRSGGAAGARESGLFFVFLECCLRKRASAGRGSRAGRLCCFVAVSVVASGLGRCSKSSEEFWDTSGAARPGPPLPTPSLQFSEFSDCPSSSMVPLISHFLGGALTHVLSLRASRPLAFTLEFLVLVCSALREAL